MDSITNKFTNLSQNAKIGVSFLIIAIIVLIIYFSTTSEKIENSINIVDNILQSTNNQLDSVIDDSSNNSSMSNEWENPLLQNINPNRNNIQGVSALQDLMNEVNQNNALQVNSQENTLFQKKARGLNSAPVNQFRKISYKDSNYRTDFNGDGISASSQSQLDSLYDNALVFHNDEYQNNNNFTGNDLSESQYGKVETQYGRAGIEGFTSGPQSQEQKVQSMFDSNNYLPNASLTNPNLEKGFQILESPTSVTNPNLIPVLKAMSVSSVLGSKRNSSQDLRGDPSSNPKTIISPWNNSSILPDIYSANRGCI